MNKLLLVLFIITLTFKCYSQVKGSYKIDGDDFLFITQNRHNKREELFCVSKSSKKYLNEAILKNKNYFKSDNELDFLKELSPYKISITLDESYFNIKDYADYHTHNFLFFYNFIPNKINYSLLLKFNENGNLIIDNGNLKGEIKLKELNSPFLALDKVKLSKKNSDKKKVFIELTYKEEGNQLLWKITEYARVKENSCTYEQIERTILINAISNKIEGKKRNKYMVFTCAPTSTRH